MDNSHSNTSSDVGAIDQIIWALDRDFKLGLFADTGADLEPLPTALFTALEKELQNASVQDWIDLGIAFMEMDLNQIAAYLFAGAQRRVDSAVGDPQHLLSSTSLLALALIQSGKGFEAVLHLQPLLGDGDIQQKDKIELLYLMGRAYESMKKAEPSQDFYLEVYHLDPQYRDVARRIQKPTDRNL